MSKGLSMALVAIGVILIIAGLLLHYVLTFSVFPHFNVVLGVIGLIIAAVGAWGLWSARQAA